MTSARTKLDREVLSCGEAGTASLTNGRDEPIREPHYARRLMIMVVTEIRLLSKEDSYHQRVAREAIYREMY